MGAGGPSNAPIRAAPSGGIRLTNKAPVSPFEDLGICNTRDGIAAKKKKVADEAHKKFSTETRAPKTTKKAEAYEEHRQLTALLDRAFTGCVEELGGVADATLADCTALRDYDPWH